MVALIFAISFFIFFYFYKYYIFKNNKKIKKLASGKPSLLNFYGDRAIVIYNGFVDFLTRSSELGLISLFLWF